MTTEMFGAPVGMQAAVETVRGLQQTRLIGAEAGLKQAELEGQRKFMDGMSQMQAGPSAIDMPTMLDNMAGIALKSGLVQKASDLSERAALIRSHMAQVAHSGMLVKQEALNQAEKELDFQGRVFGTARDQASLDARNILYTQMTGRPSPFEGKTFSPTLVKDALSQGMSTKDAAMIKIRQENQDSLDGVRESLKDHRAAQDAIANQKLTLDKIRIDRSAKTGTSTGAPNPNAIQLAYEQLHNTFPNLDDTTLQKYKTVVASRALMLNKQNAGLDYSQAMNQAIQEIPLTNPSTWMERLRGVMGGEEEGAAPTKPAAPAKSAGGSYTPEQEDWITKNMAHNKMTREQVITEGKKRGKL